MSRKLHALALTANVICKDKLRIILKSFIESQVSYCQLIWMFHSRTTNNRINRLHERALRLVYKDVTLSFVELLELDTSFTIRHRNLHKLATEMYKIKNNISPVFMQNLFPASRNPYNMRVQPEFESFNILTAYNGSETISYRGPQIWALSTQSH